MIRYPIHPAELRRRVAETSPRWLDNAAQRTETFRQLGHYDESSAIWSRIKRVYMELQGFKCGFCERLLERSAYGNIEHDVEHFRPKKRVVAWPTPTIRADRGIDLDGELGPDADPGYYLLVYHLENYVVSCKTCNSALKANFFPVAGPRDVFGDQPRGLRNERALLVYPIGALDPDPETLITFRGILPVPVGTRGHKRRRAEVTIAFFQLDAREGLLVERAESILAVYIARAAMDHPDPQVRAAAGPWLAHRLHRHAPHANCARSFDRLCTTDPRLADAYAHAAVELLEASSIPS